MSDLRVVVDKVESGFYAFVVRDDEFEGVVVSRFPAAKTFKTKAGAIKSMQKQIDKMEA